jgi:tetratricopeptide (TPR) repeat protein
MKGVLKLKISAIVLVLLVISCGLFESCLAKEQSSQDFLAAGKAYEAGDWSKATQIYESLISHAGFSASLCYNLANSYARNGQTGKAVLGYERALRLAPGDGDIRHNLEIMRQEKGLSQEETPFVQQAGALLGLNQWAVLAAILLAALSLIQFVTWRFPFSTGLSYSLTGTCLLLLGLSVTGIAIQYHSWQQAVILTPKTPLLISPFAEAASTGVIEEGLLVRVIKRHGDYTLIKDESGHSGDNDSQSGWISNTSFAPIAITMADLRAGNKNF